MIALHRIGENPFDDKELSRTELDKYSNEHLGRMTAAPAGGQLNAEIAATATVMEDFNLSLTSETVKTGVQKARTAAKAEFRAVLADEISKIHGAVVSKLGQSSPRMAEFFPDGRKVFGDCQDNVLDNKLTALRDALVAEEAANAGSFAPTILTLAGSLVTTWASLYGSATAARSQGALSADEVRVRRAALITQLYKNVLKIASIYAGQVTADGQARGAERIAHYCPQHLLENPAPSAPNPPQG